jgi:micrococcal nuclease
VSWRRAAPWLLLFALLAALGSGVLERARSGDADPEPHGSADAVVTRVVDGDTIGVRLGGRRDTVRYIGVDTPETVKPGAPVQCFGPAASAYNHRLVDGQRVTLRLDAEARDRYGRLLAYVYRRRDGLFVNAELVRGGFARTLEIPPNTHHAGELRRLQRTARTAARGLWRTCDR